MPCVLLRGSGLNCFRAAVSGKPLPHLLYLSGEPDEGPGLFNVLQPPSHAGCHVQEHEARFGPAESCAL